MNRVTAASLGVAVVFASATVMGAAPPRVETTINRVMEQNGIPMNSGSRAVYETGGGSSDSSDVEGYRAWIEIPGDEPGYLVIETRSNGSLKQVYTRYGGRISGVPSY